MRIAVLWTELSGYINSCLKVLVDCHQVELLVYRISNTSRVAKHEFNEKLFRWISELHTLPDKSLAHTTGVLTRLVEFDPDIIIASGWSSAIYRSVLRSMRQRGVFVIGGCDNPWQNTPKQWVGVAISQFFLHPLFDALWVPGERSGLFARKLGFTGDKLMYSLYCGDSDMLNKAAEWRTSHNKKHHTWPKRFLFVGRFVEEKGVRDLVAAYKNYLDEVDTPWELWCVGSGPLDGFIKAEPCIHHLGFIQPDEYVDVWKEAGVFVLPSHFEPWGVVIHEATSAGLPILCSRQCGSSVELVQEGYNGFRFEAGDVHGLTQLMIHMTLGTVNLVEYGRRSLELSQRFSPSQWCDTLIDYIGRHKPSLKISESII